MQEIYSLFDDITSLVEELKKQNGSLLKENQSLKQEIQEIALIPKQKQIEIDALQEQLTVVKKEIEGYKESENLYKQKLLDIKKIISIVLKNDNEVNDEQSSISESKAGNVVNNNENTSEVQNTSLEENTNNKEAVKETIVTETKEDLKDNTDQHSGENTSTSSTIEIKQHQSDKVLIGSNSDEDGQDFNNQGKNFFANNRNDRIEAEKSYNNEPIQDMSLNIASAPWHSFEEDNDPFDDSFSTRNK